MAIGDLLRELLPVKLRFATALILGSIAAFVATFAAMPILIHKLRGAGIVGRDVNKEDRPEVPEMGGLGVVFGLYTGVFAFLVLHTTRLEQHVIILVSLITAAGAAITGILDDLVALRQRFKAFVPLVFAAPLAVYVRDYAIDFPILGSVDFGIFYPVFLVPLAVTSGANAYNMLEGFNGLGTGLGIVMTLALTTLVVLRGDWTAAILLMPLLGALLAFLYWNMHPAKAFPGDTMTLFIGAILVSAAIIGKVEFWAALLFIPHILEFFIKARNGFPTRGWWGEPRDGILYVPEGKRPVGLGQYVMKLRGGVREDSLTLILVSAHGLLAVAVISAYAWL